MRITHPDWVAPAPAGVAIGVFDGVHTGHQVVISDLVDRCREQGLEAGVLTFDPHPVEVLAPDRAPKLLTTVARRTELLDELGAGWVATIDLAEVRDMTPERFIDEVLVARASARLVTVGDDFRFGKDRSGDVTSLRRAGGVLGFEVVPVRPVQDDQGAISSTRARRAVEGGDIDTAILLLGRPPEVEGSVTAGAGRGRALGFPTANLAVPLNLCLPADGVYAASAVGKVRAEAVVNIGRRPTFGGGERTVEAHLLDIDVDLYGSELRLAFLARLRGEESFPSVDALVAQVHRDIEEARLRFAGRRLVT